MAKFKVIFRFIGGEEKTINIERENYDVVTAEVVNRNYNWFAIKGELINLQNVTTCKIVEVTEEETVKDESSVQGMTEKEIKDWL